MSGSAPKRTTGTKCGHMVEKGHVAFQCSLIQGHDENYGEPHYAVEVPTSVRAWQVWDTEMAAVAALPSDDPEPTVESECVADPEPMDAVNSAHLAAMGLAGVSLGEQIQNQEMPDSGPDRCSAIFSLSNPGFRCALKVGHSSDHLRGTVRWPNEGLVVVPTKQREGDQQLPSGGHQCVQDLVIAEMVESKRVGLERYGSTLMTFNARRSIQDVAEEVRDLHVYLTQVKTEAEADRETLIQVVTEALKNADINDGYVESATVAVDRIMGWVVGRSSGFKSAEEIHQLLDQSWPETATKPEVLECQAQALAQFLGLDPFAG